MYIKMIAMLLALAAVCSVLGGCGGKDNTADFSGDNTLDTGDNSSTEPSSEASSDTESGKDSVSEPEGSEPVDTGEHGTDEPEESEPIDSLSLKRGINVSSLEYDGLQKDIRMYLRDPFKSETFKNIKNQGFDHVRLPVNFAANCSDGRIDEEFLKKIDGIIDMILKEELTVVLDFHGWQEIHSDVGANEELFYDIWGQLAEHYKDYPNELLFEIINEPHEESGPDPLNAANLNRIQLEAVRIIRETNPRRILALASPEWNTHWAIEDLELPENDPNIIVDMHTYQPLEFTHQGSELWANPNGDRTTVDIYDKVYREIDTVARVCRDFTASTGVKVWLGEFGIVVAVPKEGLSIDIMSSIKKEDVKLVSLAKEEDVTAYVSYVTEKMEEAGIPWAWWEYDLEFGAYDLTKNEWRDFVIDGLMPKG